MNSKKNILMLSALGLAGFVGCRSDAGNVNTDTDSGVVVDTGSTNPTDLGSPTDAGSPTDTGARTDTGPRTDSGPATTLSLTALLTPATRPANNTAVSVTSPAMVTLTPRFVAGSERGNSTGHCRFAVWVGTLVGGDFSAVQLQHEALIGDAGFCDDVEDRYLTRNLAVGTGVTSFAGTYEEFCQTAGCAAGASPTREVYLSGFATGPMAVVPTPTMVTATDVAGTATMPGSRAAALEGSLVRLSNVRLTSLGAHPDGGTATNFLVADATDTAGAHAIQLDMSNFVGAPCTRDSLTARMIGGTVASVTGILEIDFGTWIVKVRTPNDVAGANCMGDAGM